MADIRINSLPTTASASSSDDFLALDGATNGTRKLNAYSPTFGGNLTVSSSTASSSTTTGALVVTGGVGVGGAINAGSYVKAGGDVYVANGSALILDTGITNYMTGASGTGVKIYSSSALAATFAGANTTLAGNLTVSGTGNNSFTGPITNPGASWSYFTTGTEHYSISAANAVYNPTSGTWSVTTSATPSWRYDLIGHASSTSNGVEWLYRAGSAAANSWTAFMRLAGSGNLLLGTTTDSSNGKLQLATHTTSAGGIGFGTQMSLYLTAPNDISLDGLLETRFSGLGMLELNNSV